MSQVQTLLHTQITSKLNHLGGTLDPHCAFLLQRSIKTLGVRVRQQNANAMALATFLKQQPQVCDNCANKLGAQKVLRLISGFRGSAGCSVTRGSALERHEHCKRRREHQHTSV